MLVEVVKQAQAEWLTALTDGQSNQALVKGGMMALLTTSTPPPTRSPAAET
jgi:hypothetical protein